MTTGVVWLLALAVSIDGFSAGLSCGLRRLAIPFSSLLVICCSSAAAVAASMLLGGGASRFIPVDRMAVFGGAVLIVLGLYVVCDNIIKSRQAAVEQPLKGRKGLKKLYGLTRRPEGADLDHSGTVSMKEALLLGAALAADAFAAGFGAALIGTPLLFTVLAVGLVKLALVPLGLFLGRLVAEGFPIRQPGLLGGIILVFIGIITII